MLDPQVAIRLGEEVDQLRAENAKLKAELLSIDGALDDPRANPTLTTAEIIWELKAQLAAQPDPVLCSFYQVETFPDLVKAMEHHIEKLQAKVPPLYDTQPGRVREG